MNEIINVIWDWLKKQSPDIVRLICIGLFLWILGNYTLSGVKNIFMDNIKLEQLNKKYREDYTVEITPKVNFIIKDMIQKDLHASNIILLNYHNTILSSNGLSYKYLTAICELFKGVKSKPCSEYWKELDYLNYGEEIHKINMNGFTLISDLDKQREWFPKFTYLLERSGFKSAAFYPLEGVNGEVGMIIIGYSDPVTKIDKKYLCNVIVPNILLLSTLLDYDYVHNLK